MFQSFEDLSGWNVTDTTALKSKQDIQSSHRGWAIPFRAPRSGSKVIRRHLARLTESWCCTLKDIKHTLPPALCKDTLTEQDKYNLWDHSLSLCESSFHWQGLFVVNEQNILSKAFYPLVCSIIMSCHLFRTLQQVFSLSINLLS